jgi:hypothetical protein
MFIYSSDSALTYLLLSSTDAWFHYRITPEAFVNMEFLESWEKEILSLSLNLMKESNTIN